MTDLGGSGSSAGGLITAPELPRGTDVSWARATPAEPRTTPAATTPMPARAPSLASIQPSRLMPPRFLYKGGVPGAPDDRSASSAVWPAGPGRKIRTDGYGA